MDAQHGEAAIRFELAPGLGGVVLGPAGVEHPRSTALGGRCFSPWSSITDVALGPAGLRLATRSGVFFLRRRGFRDAGAPEALVQEILRRISCEPGGRAQLERMACLGARARSVSRTPVARGATLLCLLAFAAQLIWSPWVELAGVFSTSLVSSGELWRLVTANLLHAGPLHLLLNSLGLLVIGGLAERSLGSRATAFVMGLSAAGATLGSWLAGYPWALGASGVVAGLAGALIWLELGRPETVPAVWRLPRRIFIGALVGESLVMLFVPGVAHAAHAGGFVAGAAAAALAGPVVDRPPRRRLGLALADAALAGVFGIALFQAASLAGSRDPLLVEARAQVLLGTEETPADLLNNAAWLIAISDEPGPRELAAARALAERAVEQTESQDPNILDTLAEVHFAAGEIPQALDAIDRAIALAPDQPYFQEQRRRFTGERAAHDRPEPPAPPGDGLLPGRRPPDLLPVEPLDPGIRV